MRKLIIALLILALPSLSWAGSQQIRQVVGMAKVQGGVECLAGTYLFGWGGEWPNDTDKACATSGDTTGINGTVAGSPDISTTYGEGAPDVALTADANNEYIRYADSGGTLLDINGTQTIWARIYISATPAGVTRFFNISYDTSNYIYCVINTGVSMQCSTNSGGVASSVYGSGAITTGTWVDVAYSFDRPNLDHAGNTNGAWNDNLDELSATVGTDISNIDIGPSSGFGMPVSETIRITKFAIVNGYKAAKPW